MANLARTFAKPRISIVSGVSNFCLALAWPTAAIRAVRMLVTSSVPAPSSPRAFRGWVPSAQARVRSCGSSAQTLASLTEPILLGPRTEWYSAPRPAPLSPGVPDPVACAWKRGGWDESGIRRWQDLNPGQSGVSLFGQIHADCQQHHPCCQSLDVPCVESWFVPRASDVSQLNCSGAQAVVDFWFARLRKTLLQSQIQCPKR